MQPYVGYKKHTEKTEASNTFLAFRCVDPSDCATLPFKHSDYQPDQEATFASDTYTVTGPGSPNRQHMVRAVLIEDRLMPLQYEFFCDRTTEKTVTLTVTDLLAEETKVKTRKMSCQYPIFAIEDLSPGHESNAQNNSWTGNYYMAGNLNPYLSSIFFYVGWGFVQ